MSEVSNASNDGDEAAVPRRAVGYRRTSIGGSQGEEQLVEQQNGVQEFAHGCGFEIVGWYVDDSSTTLEMPDLLNNGN